MKLSGLQFSNIPADWQNPDTGITAMVKLDKVVVQAEMFSVTKTDVHGAPFAEGFAASDWFQINSETVELWAYFDPFKVSQTVYDSPVARENDPYWLRRILQQKLFDNPHWWWEDSHTGRMVTRPAYRDFCDYLVGLLLDTGIPRFYLDDATMTNKSDEDKAGAYYICNQLIDAGVELILNGGWHIEHPDAVDWTFFVLENVPRIRGVVVEYWTGGYTGQRNPDDDYNWWKLDEDRMRKLAAGWLAAGKDVHMIARYRPGETEHADYQAFAKAFGDFSQSIGTIFMPSDGNYHGFNYLEPEFDTWWSDEPQPPESFQNMTVRLANESQLISLNPYAALQKAAIADDFIPVGPEVEYWHDGVAYIVQKADPAALFTGGVLPDPRAYHVPVDHWDHVGWYPIPR